MIDVCLLGTGGMQPLPHRRLTSLYVRVNGKATLIDCGEGTQVAIKDKGLNFKAIDTICFTHYHADHVCGLPGILLAINNSERTSPVLIIGPKRLESMVNSFRFTLPTLSFPLYFYEIDDASGSIPLDSCTLHYTKVSHSITCYGYSITVNRPGKFDVEKAKANSISEKYWSLLQKGKVIVKNQTVLTSNMVLGPERKGLKVTYVTDSRPVPQIVKLAQDSDLFICEGMYDDNGDINNTDKYMHMSINEAATLAKEANVKELWLTHFSPLLPFPKAAIPAASEIFENVIAGTDGRFKSLEFEDKNEEK